MHNHICKIACARQSEICCTPAAAVQQNLDTRLHAQNNMPCGKTCARQSETCFTPAVGLWQNPDKPLHAQSNMCKTSCARQSEACVAAAAAVPQNTTYTSACAEQHLRKHMCKTACAGHHQDATARRHMQNMLYSNTIQALQSMANVNYIILIINNLI